MKELFQRDDHVKWTRRVKHYGSAQPVDVTYLGTVTSPALNTAWGLPDDQLIVYIDDVDDPHHSGEIASVTHVPVADLSLSDHV